MNDELQEALIKAHSLFAELYIDINFPLTGELVELDAREAWNGLCDALAFVFVENDSYDMLTDSNGDTQALVLRDNDNTGSTIAFVPIDNED